MKETILEEIDKMIQKNMSDLNEVWQWSDEADIYHAVIEELQTLKEFIYDLK